MDNKLNTRAKSFGMTPTEPRTNIANNQGGIRTADYKVGTDGPAKSDSSRITQVGLNTSSDKDSRTQKNIIGNKTPLENSSRPSSTSIIKDMSSSPVSTSYGNTPVVNNNSIIPTNPNQLDKNVLAGTENLLSKQLDIQTQMLKALSDIYGIVSKAKPVNNDSANSGKNTINPNTPSDSIKGPELKPYSSPKPLVPMTRTII
jgi:hypothetical protein